MFAIIGILLVFGAVIGGFFLMEKGHIAVLMQPAEFLIIVGAGLGTLLIANPVHTLKSIFSSALGVLANRTLPKNGMFPHSR
jgi:chemotaxis protein MotA